MSFELRDCVGRHEIARLPGELDRHAHTSALREGHIADDIKAAKHLVFCFGTHLPNAQVMAVRPRSIGRVDWVDRFVICFLDAPMALADNAMDAWVEVIADRPQPAAA